MAGSHKVVARWRAGWEKRYDRQAPKIDGRCRSEVAKACDRIPEVELLAGVDEYLADDWPECMAHRLNYFLKRADEYVAKAAKRNGGSRGKTGKGIVVEGDEQHEAECEQWRREWRHRRASRKA